LKYNKNKSKYELLQREKTTISKIHGKEWNLSFEQKAIDTYYEFRESGIELTDHGVARLLDRFEDKKEAIKVICKNKPYNYVQDDGKRIKHYDSIAIVYAAETDEIVSFVDRCKPKIEWSRYDKSDT